MPEQNKDENQIVEEAVTLVNTHFLPEENGVEIQGGDISVIKNKLSLLIEYLLLHNFEKLLNAVYRVDIDEKKFKEAMERENSKQISDEIAGLVIERELQKAEYRVRYKS